VTKLALVQRPKLGFYSWLFVIATTVACHRDVQGSPGDEKNQTKPAATNPTAAATPKLAALRPVRAPGRVVAIGDLHGDLTATRRAFRTSKVIDEADQWIGGNSVVVQTGDVLDRGNEERPLLEWLERLTDVAKAGGGALYRLNGNHEVMNVAGDLRYVTDDGFAAFAEYAQTANARQLHELPAAQRGRLVAFLPGGPWARRLAAYPAVLIVNDSVFTHGGLTPKHVSFGLEQLNTELSAWMRGTGKLSPVLAGDEAPYWNRTYGDAVSDADCQTLEAILTQLSVKRLVIGHTPQKGGVSFACNEHVIRIDVGLSSFYGTNPSSVLEINGDQVSVLAEGKAVNRPTKRLPTESVKGHP